MMLSDVRDYVKRLDLAERVYMGKLDAKEEKSIGVYNSKHSHPYKTAIGGAKFQSYGTKHVTFLVHWNESPRATESAAERLFQELAQTREVTINGVCIKFIQPLTDGPVDVGTDEAGIFEMVIEAAVIYGKEQIHEKIDGSISGI